MMLRKRQTDTNEPLLSDYDYTPKPDDGYPSLTEDSDQLSVYNEKEGKPMTWFWNVLFVILGFATRYYHIWAGDFVLWDEAHFGKFGSYYLQRTFYFDVHPPLGKMLIGEAGRLVGYDGDFGFPSGSKYPATVNYVGMRMVLAAFGAMLVPMAYKTAVQLGLSHGVCVLVGFMVLADVGLLGVSRLILLDSMLIFFATLAVYSYCRFRSNKKAFGLSWWRDLAQTGLAIGCVSSVKWVGFFVTALIGLMTVEELLGWIKARQRLLLVKHFLARALCLIVLPISIYVGCFYLHFAILNESGSGDTNMSSLFQARLKGNKLFTNPVMVHNGSQVTLKSNSYGGGLLHSHVQPYPHGSRQQQVTTYHHNDANNNWIILGAKGFSFPNANRSEEWNGTVLKDGQVIKLLHKKTGHLLHAHATYRAPITTTDYEVTGYGREGLEDPNDLWRVEVVDEIGSIKDGSVRSLTTIFRLRHVNTGCLLKSRNVHLPQWGFKQGEVSCDPNPRNESASHFLWNVEAHVNIKLPPGEPADYPTSFWRDFRDCNVGMYINNSSLVPDPEAEDGILTSRPIQWLFMQAGIRMSSWAENATRFYMLGNPLVWWTGSVSVILNACLAVYYFLLDKRQGNRYKNYSHRVQRYFRLKEEAFYYRVKVIIGAWIFNYLPFFLMGRVTYVHHYYPALVMSILSVGVLLDHLVNLMSLRARSKWVMGAMFLSCLIASFIYFSPFAYGMDGSLQNYANRQWVSSWNIV